MDGFLRDGPKLALKGPKLGPKRAHFGSNLEKCIFYGFVLAKYSWILNFN